jgi:polysaccharide export outer membrane protein
MVLSCKSYQANILFEVEEEDMEKLAGVVVEVNQNYLVSPNDQLEIEVFTNRGEELIDPNNSMGDNRNVNTESRLPVYLVKADGTVDLPIIGMVKLGGMTISEVNTHLEQVYKVYYREPYVRARYVNKKVIILGAIGGQIIPLEVEGMNLLEVIAMAGGINNDAKGHNIRLIRGDLSNPQVQVIDLSTIEGMARANLEVQPDDIIYVEPVRRPFTEGLKDVVPILSLLTSVLALVVALTR